MESGANKGARLRDWLNTASPSPISYQNRLGERKKIPNEELVKYMSNLPSYLEKGDNLREKAFGFGVLDWRHLEKWQHNHKQTFYASSSNNSSYFSTDISSTRSSRGQSCSPGETAVKEVDEFRDLKEKLDKSAEKEHELYRKCRSYGKLQGIKPKECQRKEIEVQGISKTKARDGKFTRQVQELNTLDAHINHTYHEKGKHKAPSDDFESNHRGGTKQPSLNIKVSYESFKSPSRSSRTPISPSKCEKLEDRPTKVVDGSEPIIGIVENHKSRDTSRDHMLSIGLNRRSGTSNSLNISSKPVQSKSEQKKDVDYSCSEIPTLRNPSPTRSFSIGLKRFSRRSSSPDFSDAAQMSSGHDSYISKLKRDAGFLLENSCNDKPNVGRKSQMSPLRRLLDPLLKPKAVNSNHSAETSKKDSDKMYLKRSEPSNGKNKPSTVQALVQMSIKNGLPLFTFADDKNSGVLAATMKKVTALEMGDSSWIYTFFNVDEVKKKNAWINKGCKGETHGCIPSVVAQMRVSDIRQNPINKGSTRKFVSFAVDVSENDQKSSNFRPKDEVAAILVKFPEEAPPYNAKVKGGSNHVNYPPFSIMAILPGGSHGLPSKGKPSPLIERWKSGGLCDCGGWDLGCRLKVLSNQEEYERRSNFSDTCQAADIVELFPRGEVVDDRPVFILSPFKDNIYSVEFDSSLSFLQAFSICISILNCGKPYGLSELSKLFEGKPEHTIMAGDVVKAPNPPLSPVGRV